MADQNNDASTAATESVTAFEAVLIVGGLILFLALLYEMESPDTGFLNPPLIAAAGVILLWPLRTHRAVRALLYSGGFLLTLWFLSKVSTVLIPFVIVYVLAYLFNPTVSYLRRRYRFPRWASSLVVTTLVLGIMALFILLIVPSIVSQLETLGGRILNSADDLRDWIAATPMLDQLEATGLISKEELTAEVTATLRNQAESLTRRLPRAAEGLMKSIGSVIGGITIVAILPVILFYTLKDYPFIKRSLVGLFPTFAGRRDYLIEAGGIVGNYLRGQLLISAIAAFNVSVALLLLDVPFALLIGLLGGLLNLIPNLGIIITYIIGGLLAIIFGDPWYIDAISVFAVLMGQSLLEQTVLTPNILSYQVGLHPVLIILSLFVFGYFLGIFGLLIAVPATALIVTSYKALREEISIDLADYDEASDAAPDTSSKDATHEEAPASEVPASEPDRSAS